MTALTLLNTTIPAIKPENTFIQALEWMGELHIQHLAYINKEGILQSIVSEYELLDQEDLYQQMETYKWQSSEIVASQYDSIYELLTKIQQHKLSAIPVIDTAATGLYMGLVTQQAIIDALGSQYATYAKGGLIKLIMPATKYSMVEIAKIVESNKAKVLSSLLDYDAEASEVTVLLKINNPEMQHIIATFERYDYEVFGLTQDSNIQHEDKYKENYNALMKYLDV